jgi:protease I
MTAAIGVIIADMFEDSEYSDPVKAFSGAGHRIVNIGFETCTTVKGKHGTPVTIDKTIKGSRAAHFDALLIPGGYSPDILRADPDAVRFTKEFVESGKPVFVICHGPQLLVSAGVLKGRKITSWKSVRCDVINAGAEFIDEEVVEDGNILSSRSPADLPAFIKASLKKLQR